MPVTRKRKQSSQTQSQSSLPVRTHVEFSAITKYQAFYRQWNRCACCGESLSFQNGQAHHVIPAQSTNGRVSDNAFLRSVDNCVILCKHCYTDEMNTSNPGKGTISSPRVYNYSHGLERLSHQRWAKNLSYEQQKKNVNTRNNTTVSML